MKNNRNPEKAIEGLIVDRLRAGAVAGEECPSPEILATYFERALPEEETLRWESHFASCPRCREHLLALVRSDTAVSRPASQHAPGLAWIFDWRWLAPTATAAAAVLLLLVSRPAPLPIQTPDLQLEHRVAQAPAPEASVAAVEATPAAAGKPAAREKTATALARDEGERRAAVSPPGRKAELQSEPVGATKALSATHEFALKAAPVTPPQEKKDVAQPAAQEAQKQDVFDLAARRKAAAEPAAAAVREEDIRADRAPVEGLAALQAGQQPAVRGLRMRSNVVDATAEVGSLVITSPKTDVLWRTGPLPVIEQSRDGGRTWNEQKRDLDVKILAGSAPTEKVCWLVGRSGAVLRTTNGKTWRRIVFPHDFDLVAVEARDAQNATVTTAEGQRFTTTDGGRNWRPL